MFGLDLQCENETLPGKLIYHIFLALHNYQRPPSWTGKYLLYLFSQSIPKTKFTCEVFLSIVYCFSFPISFPERVNFFTSKSHFLVYNTKYVKIIHNNTSPFLFFHVIQTTKCGLFILGFLILKHEVTCFLKKGHCCEFLGVYFKLLVLIIANLRNFNLLDFIIYVS